MKKNELRELYQMMFPEYPDIVTVKELREMLGISRKLAYKLIGYADPECGGQSGPAQKEQLSAGLSLGGGDAEDV